MIYIRGWFPVRIYLLKKNHKKKPPFNWAAFLYREDGY